MERRTTNLHAFVQDSVVVDAECEDLDLLEAEEGDAMPPTRSSHCSGVVDVEEEEVLKSVLVPKEVIKKYQHQEQRLKKELEHIALEDHIWYLKSWDINRIGVVKIHCGKCYKDFGGSTRDHTKANIHNLFANFF